MEGTKGYGGVGGSGERDGQGKCVKAWQGGGAMEADVR